jgi:hypothetical protein
VHYVWKGEWICTIISLRYINKDRLKTNLKWIETKLDRNRLKTNLHTRWRST